MLANQNKCLYNKHMFELQASINLQNKLHILADAAKYDVACTSSGTDRRGKKGMLGNAKACGICHTFASDGRCISLLKILMTNHCIYDCKYCINRSSNDIERATFSPSEICELTIEFYKRNYIEGLFLSSGVIKNPTYTMERMCETLALLRGKYRFNGYIHIKTIPGASDELIAMAGLLADRISINMELPTKESLKSLAPNKSFSSIITPMAKVSNTIASSRSLLGKTARMERSSSNRLLSDSIFSRRDNSIEASKSELIYGNTGHALADSSIPAKEDAIVKGAGTLDLSVIRDIGVSQDFIDKRRFASAGQSTQMIIGASAETDYTLINTTQKLYQTFDLKRVFYSAYIPINEDSALPALGTPPPLLREHRLYQADWLLRFYGFTADELLSEDKPNFNEKLDPKCDWAIRHLDIFPIEVQTAPYDLILRVPGIGPKSAMRIINARRYGKLDYESLKKMGVVLKRAHYFITCCGRMMFRIPIEEGYITRQLTDMNTKENWQVCHVSQYRQLSLFEDFGVS